MGPTAPAEGAATTRPQSVLHARKTGFPALNNVFAEGGFLFGSDDGWQKSGYGLRWFEGVRVTVMVVVPLVIIKVVEIVLVLEIVSGLSWRLWVPKSAHPEKLILSIRRILKGVWTGVWGNNPHIPQIGENATYSEPYANTPDGNGGIRSDLRRQGVPGRSRARMHCTNKRSNNGEQ